MGKTKVGVLDQTKTLKILQKIYAFFRVFPEGSIKYSPLPIDKNPAMFRINMALSHLIRQATMVIFL